MTNWSPHLPHNHKAIILCSSVEPLYANTSLRSLDTAMRVLQYLKSSPCQGIVLPKNNNLQLVVFYHSNWASCSITQKSTSGYLMKLGNAPI